MKYALREIGRRISNLTVEMNATEKHITKLVEAVAPTTFALPQVGVITAAQLLITGSELRPIPQRSSFRQAVRRRAHPCLIWENPSHEASPRRQPTG